MILPSDVSVARPRQADCLRTVVRAVGDGQRSSDLALDRRSECHADRAIRLAGQGRPARRTRDCERRRSFVRDFCQRSGQVICQNDIFGVTGLAYLFTDPGQARG